jgi:hypothetical protein
MVRAESVGNAFRRLHDAGLLAALPAERAFDLWLIALRAGKTSPSEAAKLLGGDPALWRPRISRAVANTKRAKLVTRVSRGTYRLEGPGVTRADELVREFRKLFRQLL